MDEDLEPDYDGPIDIYGESLTGVSSEFVQEIARQLDERARQIPLTVYAKRSGVNGDVIQIFSDKEARFLVSEWPWYNKSDPRRPRSGDTTAVIPQLNNAKCDLIWLN